MKVTRADLATRRTAKRVLEKMYWDVKLKKKRIKAFLHFPYKLPFWFVETFVHERVTFTYE